MSPSDLAVKRERINILDRPNCNDHEIRISILEEKQQELKDLCEPVPEIHSMVEAIVDKLDKYHEKVNELQLSYIKLEGKLNNNEIIKKILIPLISILSGAIIGAIVKHVM